MRRAAVVAGVVLFCSAATASAWSLRDGGSEDSSGASAGWHETSAGLVQGPWEDAAPRTVQRGGGQISLQDATRLALQRHPGRVAGAETITRNGRREHRIRILTEDNRVRTVRIDAQTGRFL